MEGKRILLGITGSIAAYKAAVLVRLLRLGGAEVQVVMTKAATEFIAPLTLQALSGREVRQEMFDSADEAAVGHIELARWADLVLIAPASADFIARLNAGMGDDLLATICLATQAPIVVAPAMNQLMWLNPATQDNVQSLRQRGVQLWGPAKGDQACGEVGPGRMLEPEEIYSRSRELLASGPLQGLQVVLTAGPTREPIDPVRFIGNRSSGKMGYALARAFRDAGAEVLLVSGPVALEVPAGVEYQGVDTALEMEQAVLSQVDGCDIFVACAAVADYRPVEAAPQKIKKSQPGMEVELTRNPDILAAVAALPKPPFTVGFAAETERLIEQGEAKRQAKGVDMIAANLVASAEGGFERDENALTVLWEGGGRELPLASKALLAVSLVELISERYHAKD
jgi:phosphopantothenoylcysteine decarboxylase/phosphopantothenate--cysteine ligase